MAEVPAFPCYSRDSFSSLFRQAGCHSLVRSPRATSSLQQFDQVQDQDANQSWCSVSEWLSRTGFHVSETCVSSPRHDVNRGFPHNGRSGNSHSSSVGSHHFGIRVNLRGPLFEESTVINYGVPGHLNKDYRLSWTAYLNRVPVTQQELEDHEVVKCIEKRAAIFQGHIPIENMEELQVVKYKPKRTFAE